MSQNHTQITISKSVMLKEMLSQFEDFEEVTIRAKGRSMAPYVRDGSDILIFRRADPAALAVGDVVLASTTNGIVAHRIIKTEGETLTLKGDGNLYGTETCRRADVAAVMVGLERGGVRIDCNTPAERLKALRMRRLYQFKGKTKHMIKRMLQKLHLMK